MRKGRITLAAELEHCTAGQVREASELIKELRRMLNALRRTLSAKE